MWGEDGSGCGCENEGVRVFIGMISTPTSLLSHTLILTHTLNICLCDLLLANVRPFYFVCLLNIVCSLISPRVLYYDIHACRIFAKIYKHEMLTFDVEK